MNSSLLQAAMLKLNFNFSIIIDVQVKFGGKDGAIAFATTQCIGEDPHLTSYVQEDLRSHAPCLGGREKKMSAFPAPDRPKG